MPPGLLRGQIPPPARFPDGTPTGDRIRERTRTIGPELDRDVPIKRAVCVPGRVGYQSRCE